MIVGRFILGLGMPSSILLNWTNIPGVGTAAAIAPVYIGELAPTRFRGAMVTIQSIAITGGQFIAYCIGIPLTGHHGWRIQFAIGVIPAIIQGAAM
jgi:SP family myo-inositol transporter-like MFS transporter 13